MADLLVAPYLPLSTRVQVGRWEFVPFRDFAVEDTTSREVHEYCERLVAAYAVDSGGGPVGAVLRVAAGRVGDEFDRGLIRPLSRALVAAVLDDQGEGPRLDGEDEDPNQGHATATSENALVYGHPLVGGESYVIGQGAMVTKMDLRYAPPGEPLPKIDPPIALHLPLFTSTFDSEYAAALLEVLERGAEQSRRLDRSIEWLAVAWRNEEAVTHDMRILALRAGFEILFGGGSSTKRHRAALHDLLDEPSASRRPRSWIEHGKETHADLTDLEWWFQSFALLRNAIAHGDAIAEDQWAFDGQLHLWRGEHTLRRAIKRTIVRAAHDADLELDRATRELRRALLDATHPGT